MTCQADQAKKNALLWAFVKHYKWQILAAMPARIAYSAFTISQPFLVQRVLDFTSAPPSDSDRNTGYGLIGAYAIVYIGIAVCHAICRV